MFLMMLSNYATRAHEAILKKIVESKKLRSVFIRLFSGRYVRVAMRLITHWRFSKNQPEGQPKGMTGLVHS